MNDTGQLSIEKLQQELSLKQLQINSLLTITQAINDNVAAPELYSMYKSFIGWEMGIKRMALFFKQDDEWECATHLQADQLASRHDLGPILKRYTKTQRIIDTDPEPLQGLILSYRCITKRTRSPLPSLVGCAQMLTNTHGSSLSRRLPTSSL